MDFETLNVVDENMYRWALMLIQFILLMVAAASLLFILVSVVCAVCGFFTKTKRPARPKAKPEPPDPDAHQLLAVLAGLDEDLDESLTDSLPRRRASSIQQA